jgi:hypothetical protein
MMWSNLKLSREADTRHVGAFRVLADFRHDQAGQLGGRDFPFLGHLLAPSASGM